MRKKYSLIVLLVLFSFTIFNFQEASIFHLSTTQKSLKISDPGDIEVDNATYSAWATPSYASVEITYPDNPNATIVRDGSDIFHSRIYRNYGITRHYYAFISYNITLAQALIDDILLGTPQKLKIIFRCKFSQYLTNSHTITSELTKGDTQQQVKYYDWGLNWRNIEYEFNITSGNIGNNNSIKINITSAADFNPSGFPGVDYFDTWIETFFIGVNYQPEINFTSPSQNNELVSQFYDYDINVSISDPELDSYNNVSVRVYNNITNPILNWTNMTQVGSTDQWTHTIQPILFPNDQYIVEVRVADDLGYAYKSISILITNMRPQIQFQNIENNDIISHPTNFTLDITIVDNEGDVFSNASIMIYDSNNNPQLPSWNALTHIIGSDYAFSFNPSDFGEGTYIISVRAEDDKGVGYTNITITIRFEEPFDPTPFIIIGVAVSVAVIGVIVAFILIKRKK
jgi:hypothetical protein